MAPVCEILSSFLTQHLSPSICKWGNWGTELLNALPNGDISSVIKMGLNFYYFAFFDWKGRQHMLKGKISPHFLSDWPLANLILSFLVLFLGKLATPLFSFGTFALKIFPVQTISPICKQPTWHHPPQPVLSVPWSPLSQTMSLQARIYQWSEGVRRRQLSLWTRLSSCMVLLIVKVKSSQHGKHWPLKSTRHKCFML